MDINVEKFDKEKYDDIKDAIEKEWILDHDFQSSDDKHTSAMFAGESSLCGGEGEDEFAKRVAKSIMKANGGPCEVSVQATFLEDLPHESYYFDEDNYKELMKDE